MFEIKVKCPAKINLTLEVLDKRPDGFHNIQSVMQAIDLFDILIITVEKSNKFEIKLSGTSDEIPYDGRNLVYKAAKLFYEEIVNMKLETRNGKRNFSHCSLLNAHRISVHIEKNIPVAAGLAGGSTDAAGTLWGLNKLFGNVLSDKELHELCARLGSDLNFCLEGGCRLATGRGEILEKLPFQEFRLSLIKPKNLGISAKEAYIKYADMKLQSKLGLTRQSRLGLPAQQQKADKNELEDMTLTEKLFNALKSGNTNIQDFLHNDLEIALIEDYKELKEIKTAYPKSLMSGSGSTFFVLGEYIDSINENYWIKTGLKSISYGVSEL